jgi:hypothetical protein
VKQQRLKVVEALLSLMLIDCSVGEQEGNKAEMDVASKTHYFCLFYNTCDMLGILLDLYIPARIKRR